MAGNDDSMKIRGIVEIDKASAEKSAQEAGKAAAKALEGAQRKAEKLGDVFSMRKADADRNKAKREELIIKKNVEAYEKAEKRKRDTEDREHRKGLRARDEATREYQRREKRAAQEHSQGLVKIANGITALSGPLRHIPGGALLHQSLQGMTGAATAAHNNGAGFGGTVRAGLMGGLQTAGLGLLDRAVGMMVQGMVGDEQTRYSLAQAAGGDVGMGGKVLGSKRYGLLRSDAAAYQMQALRAGGGRGAAEEVTRLSHRGLGGEYAGLLSAVGQTGGAVGTEGVDAKAKKLWTEIMASGMAQGLQKGRFGELISGATSLVSRGTAGVASGDLGSALRLQMRLAKSDSVFQGQAGFSSIARMDEMVKGGGGGLNRAFALMTAGLGTPGVDYGTARMNMEKGLTGEGADAKSAEKMLDRYLQSFGGDKKMAAVAMADQGAAGSVTEAYKWLEMKEKGGISEEDFEKMKSSAASEDEKLTKAMEGAQGQMHHLQAAIEHLGSTLGKLLTKMAVVERLANALETLNGFLSNPSGAVAKALFGSAGGAGGAQARALGKGEDALPARFMETALQNPMASETMSAEMRHYNARSMAAVGQRDVTRGGRTQHVVIFQLFGEDGRVLREVELSAQSLGMSPQAP